jgi:hypothetical protein
MDPFWFAIAGDRVVYPSYSGRGRWIWLGTIAGRVRKIRTALRGSAGPVFVGRRIGYVPYDGRRILFVGGGSLIPALPSHAVIQEVAAHGDRVAVYATWGNAVGSTYRGALFVVAGGRTTKIGDEPNPLGEAPSPVWSPDGKRIAIIRNGDIWTIRPDGSHAVRITRTSSPLQGGERSPVWSPDSRRLAYAGRGNRVFDTYAAPATGGRERRLTRTAKAPPAVPQLGTIPLAWLGNWIAVERYNALGVIPARGGHITILCRLRPAGSAGWGQASWRR